MKSINLKTIFALSVASVSFAACSVEEDAAKSVPVQESYTRDFIKTFGTINPNQDWNVVEQKNVTINSTSPVDVLIFEKQGGKYKLAADYKAVSGSKTITFDGMEGDNTSFIVSLDGNMVFASNGETLNYNGSSASRIKRAAETSSWVTRDDETTTITLVSNEKKFKSLKNEGADHYDSFLDICNEDGMSYAISQGYSKTLFPVYHGSEKTYELGMYYYDANEGTNIYVPMYKTGEHDDDFGEITDTDDQGRGGQIVSHGYTISPTKDIVASIYVKCGDKYYYSNPELNENKQELFATATVSSNVDGGYRYIVFDDPEDNSGDNDFNDLIFIDLLKYNTGEITKKDTISYLVACEDLGGTFDYDFNDVVFRVSHVSGNDYLTINPVAAGGTLEAYLCYNNKVVSNEWHKHFGNGHDISDMINTGYGIPENNIMSIRLTGVPTDFSMTKFSSADGGFSVKVIGKNGKETTTVTGPNKGAAPQMLVLPSNWKWPKELTNIVTTYPKFGEWGANYTDATWVETITDGNYIDMDENKFTSTGEKTVEVK